VTAMAAAALAVELIPAIAFGFATERIARSVSSWPAALRVSFPALFVLPYLMVSLSARIFQWSWFALYVLLPVAIAGLLVRAARVDAEQRGNWRDAFVLLVVGLAVDLRWFEAAWPSGLRALNELLIWVPGDPATARNGIQFLFEVERLENWATGVGLLRTGRDCVWNGAGIYPSTLELAGDQQRGVALGIDIFLYCGAGGIILPRMGAEFVGAATGASRCVGDCVDSVWALAF
jgi:hypothetical protein